MSAALPIEHIEADGKLLAIIIRAAYAPDHTTFVSPPELTEQVGFIVHKEGHEIARHRHAPVERSVDKTREVLFIRKGSIEASIYTDEGREARKCVLAQGDAVVLVDCGHGFKMLEDTVLFEIKQGPYAGEGEKEFF